MKLTHEFSMTFYFLNHDLKVLTSNLSILSVISSRIFCLPLGRQVVICSRFLTKHSCTNTGFPMYGNKSCNNGIKMVDDLNKIIVKVNNIPVYIFKMDLTSSKVYLYTISAQIKSFKPTFIHERENFARASSL